MPLGPNVRVFQGPWARSWAEIKTRFYAGNLVSQGPSGTYGVGWMRRPYRYRQPWAGYPMGCHIGRLTRHENWRDLRRPLKFPNLIVSLTRFGHVLEGYVGPPFSICARPRRLVIEIRQIWGWVSPPVVRGRTPPRPHLGDSLHRAPEGGASVGETRRALLGSAEVRVVYGDRD